MPRRGLVVRRRTPPDYHYHSVLVRQLIHKLMRQGRKSKAEKICYGAMRMIGEKKKGESDLAVFEKAVENIKPKVEVKARRVGGATYQVPLEVHPRRQVSLALRWLVEQARARPEKSMKEKLAAEILEAFQGQGGAVKKREEVHRVAEANRAFAHYRW